ncbi:MAG: hypothetical protein ACK53Y_16345, partial [bacterium]
SFADVEDKYEITYVRGQKFTVHMPEEDVVFERKAKLYVADWCVETAVNATKGISLTQVLLDNQADISVMHPMMLSDVRPAKRKIRVSGVGRVLLIVNNVFFFQVYASKETKANV